MHSNHMAPDMLGACVQTLFVKKGELIFSVYCFQKVSSGLEKWAVEEVRTYAALQKRQTLQALELIPTVKIIHKTEYCELSLFLLTMINVSLQDVTLQNQRAMGRESGCRKNIENLIYCWVHKVKLMRTTDGTYHI